MFTKAERLISLRNLRPKKKEGFLKIISIFSFLGITLGVAILIIVMSVMNGFKTELTNKILGLNPHIVIQPNDFKIESDFILKLKNDFKDRGAEIADLILPSAAFTEQNGLYENLEGRVQECKKASYPVGEALEDWKILNLILKALGKNENLLNFELLRKEVLNLIPNFTKLNELPNFKNSRLINTSPYFESEEVNIKELDYFFTNAISRASKTMSECRQIKHRSKKTGTDNL